MNINCIGTVGIINTEQKFYWYKRKGYYIGDKYVKPRKLSRVKNIPIKDPYLYGDIKLVVDADLVLGGMYADENGKRYVCTESVSIQNTVCTLRITTMYLGKEFSVPKTLTFIPVDIQKVK